MFCSIFLLLFIAQSSLSKKYYNGPVDYDRVCYANLDKWSGPVCLDDSSGFFKVFCTYHYDRDKNWKWLGWKPKKKIPFTKCSKGKKCICDDFPKFPQYGLLTYNGSQYGDSDGPFNDPFNGTTAKDGNGRYYTEFKGYIFSQGRWIRKQKFELILPKNGSFVKYAGWFGNRNCKTTFPHGPGDPLFKTYNYYTMYEKKYEGLYRDNYIQRWYHQNCNNENFCDLAKYEYIYDKETNIAIPLKYTHFHQYHRAYQTDEKHFVYKDVIEDQNIFDVSTYCDGFH